MGLATNSVISRHVRGLICDNISDREIGLNISKPSICESTSSRRVTYRVLKPDLTVDVCYVKGNNVSERHRIAYSQFKVSRHKLAIESGRWNRCSRGRLPMEERLRPCGSVQRKLQVLECCPLTDDIRAHR
ncbi:hypothetical protein E2C01_066703 [Portunus trituberculatus]|uniref:Uncharacterized protein n=1 Tax=Portunus trituberculatus TaxID=210409 RepID=A0A5B7HUJ6_PORTR|nr:hypothetical protein [Portunus trituberculatus]